MNSTKGKKCDNNNKGEKRDNNNKGQRSLHLFLTKKAKKVNEQTENENAEEMEENVITPISSTSGTVEYTSTNLPVMYSFLE